MTKKTGLLRYNHFNVKVFFPALDCIRACENQFALLFFPQVVHTMNLELHFEGLRITLFQIVYSNS